MPKAIFIFFSCWLFAIEGLMAQLCQGSLGDPIVNLNFGQGSNPGGPLGAASTNYQYATNDCPQDGFYTVRNNTIGCYGNTWHSLNADHTGNPSGYMMLVNASYQPGAFYLDTVKGLCGNTTYEFAGWIMNMLVPSSCNGNTIQPNITFSIERTDGSVVQSYNTGNIPPLNNPLWKQYGFYFITPPSGEDIVLRMLNNAPGGCGNDLALDDISFRPCGPLLTASIAGMNTDTASVCEGTAAVFSFSCTVSAGFTNPSLQWQQRFNGGPWSDITSETDHSLTRDFAVGVAVGTYQYRLTVAEAGNLGSPQCRIASRTLSVTVNAKPVTTASSNSPVCEGETLMLTASGAVQYYWTRPNGVVSFGSPLALENIQLGQAGKYFVTATSAPGCTQVDSTMVVVNPASVAIITNPALTVCAGDTVQLVAGGGSAYAWIPAVGLSDASAYNPKAFPIQTTYYQVIVSNAFSCTDTAGVLLSVVQKPVADAGPDKALLEGHSVQLSGTTNSPGNTYSWSPAAYISNSQSLQPVVNPPRDTFYVLEARSNSGCGTATDTVLVKVYKDIFIPGAFTPNGDGINDTWNIPVLVVFPLFELKVYNRWGEEVFQAKHSMKPWDGTFKGGQLPAGTYIYFIKTGSSQRSLKGTVMLFR